MTDIPAFQTARIATAPQPRMSRSVTDRVPLLVWLMRTAMVLSFCGAMVIPDHEVGAKVLKFDIIFKNAVRRLAAS